MRPPTAPGLEPPAIGETRLAPGLAVLTMPKARGVQDYVLRGYRHATVIYARKGRDYAAPLAPSIDGTRLLARSVIVLPPGIETRWSHREPIWDDSPRLQALHLRLTDDIAETLERKALLGDLRPALNAPVRGLAHLMERALRAFEAPAAFRRIALQSVALAAATRLLEPGERFEAPEASSMTARRLRALRVYVEENLADDVDIAGMARAVGLSPSYFIRAFKAATGETPYAFVMRQRIERVKAEMMTGRLPLREVAARSGFASQSHMTEAFRKATGVPPGRWRRLVGVPEADGDDGPKRDRST